MSMRYLFVSILALGALACSSSDAVEASPSPADAATYAEGGGGGADVALLPPADSGAPIDARSTPDAKPDAAAPDSTAAADAAAADAAPPDVGPPVLCELTPKELHDALANKDFLLIDVHTPYAGTIPGTDARISYNDINAIVTFIGQDLDVKVVLTCLSGGMSASAGGALVARGYRGICELTGGMMAWERAGYTLDRDGG